jgi:hypothetical protein
MWFLVTDNTQTIVVGNEWKHRGHAARDAHDPEHMPKTSI